MATFEDLYGAWSAADEAARQAEADVIAALHAQPVVPAYMHNQAVALRGIANRLLDEAMGAMRADATPRPGLWRRALALTA
jgi:hypothetical protein